MAIEQSYMDKINEIKQVSDTLTPFETKFIFGEGDSQPIADRESISDKQKAMVDRIYKERVQQMDREAASTIDFGNPRVTAVQEGGNKTYRVVVDTVQVGAIINFGEATNIVAWLSTILTDGHLTVAVAGATAAPAAEDDFPGE